MTPDTQAYSEGDWIVHRNHGVGRIKGTEIMTVGGQKNSYCKIQTAVCTYWLPLDKINDDWVRPLSSPAEIQDALDALGDSPVAMDSNPTERKIRFNKVGPINSLVVIAELVRDLSAFNRVKKPVSQSDLEAQRSFIDIFLSEWSTSMDLDLTVVRRQLDAILAQGMIKDNLTEQ